MDLEFQAGATPLAARQNPIIYGIILIALLITAVFILIWLFTKYRKTIDESPEKIQQNKTRPTNSKDVKTFSKKYNLPPEDEKFLIRFCKKYQIPNIIYAVKEKPVYTSFFENFVRENKDSLSENDLYTLFLLRYKFERINADVTKISGTFSLPKDTKFREIFSDGSTARYRLFENTKDYLALQIPEQTYESRKNQNLEKIALTFTTEDEMSYAIVTRVLRYEKREDNLFLMIVTHSNNLITKTQRAAKRLYLTEKTNFSAVKIETVSKGNIKYIPSETKYACTLNNISKGGCCISTTLPIKESQFVNVEIPLKSETLNLVGKIVHTRKSNSAGSYNLHIQFNPLSIPVQNKILSKVWNCE